MCWIDRKPGCKIGCLAECMFHTKEFPLEKEYWLPDWLSQPSDPEGVCIEHHKRQSDGYVLR
jgi:hypothetical protein